MNRRTLSIDALGEMFDGPHATPTRRDDGPYFLNIASLSSGRLDLTLSDHVSPEDFKRWTRRVTPEAGDLLFSYETRLGEAALMPVGVDACLGRRMALLRPDRTVVDPRFLLYFYLSPAFQDTIRRNTVHGVTVNRIALSTMGSWNVDVPALSEQQAIGAVLGALDDKIAANREAAATAWSIAGAQFVRLMKSATSTATVRDVLELKYGKSLPAGARRPGPVPVYGSGGIAGTHVGALVPAAGVVVGRKGTVGAVYWAPGPHWPIDTTFMAEPKNGWPSQFCYFLLQSLPLSDMNSDSAVPGLNRVEAEATPIRLPDRLTTQEFGAQASRLMALTTQLEDENRCLAEIRDALLPALMSGRLRVKDAEKVVGEAV